MDMEGLFLVICIIYLSGTPVLTERGIIVTAPKTWAIGDEETICVSFHGIHFDVATQTTVELKYSDNDLKIYEKEVTFNQGTDSCFGLVLGSHKGYPEAKLLFRAVGMAEDGDTYSFSRNTSIQVQDIQTKANITFIETDKPIYKAGDTVQLRILTIQEELKPRMETLPLVTVVNPLGIRVRQWRDVSVAELQGLASLSFDLSDEPTLGQWKITAQREDGQKHDKTFKIEEYVLPKFEVVITPPAFIPAWVDTVDFEICARYTYGQPVKGNVSISACVGHKWYGREVCQTVNLPIDGCHTWPLPLQQMVLENQRNKFDRMGRVKMTASVVEEGTGISLTSSVETGDVSYQHYEIKFIDTPEYFRPGINFTGKVRVKDNMGGPVDNLQVIIEVENTKRQIRAHRRHTDSDGIVSFEYQHLPIDDKADMITLRAKFVPSFDYGAYEDAIHDPAAMMSVKVWYSPSRSYMQIKKIPGSVDCGQDLEADVALRFPHGHERTFYYKVTVQNRLILQSSTRVTPAGDSEDHMKLKIALPELVWGDATLLVYTVTRGGEVIADSTEFKVKHCVQNKVSLEFSEREVAPGDEISLQLSASPGSLCAYGIMDKSIQLLGGSNTISMESIMSKVPTKSAGGHYSHSYFNDPYCQQKKREEREEEEEGVDEDEDEDDILLPGPPAPMGRLRKNRPDQRRNRNRDRKNKRIPRSSMPYFPGNWYSRFVDANKAFQISDLVVLSDLEINTRPCDQYREYPGVYYSAPGPMMPRGMPGLGAAVEENIAFDNVAMLPGMEMEDLPTEKEPVKVVDSVRSFFPETWLWDIVPISERGGAEIIETAPDTITEWSGHAVCTSVSDGLGISGDATLRTFQPFFVSLSLPYSAVRGETVLLPVSVFNYLSDCLVISLEILPSPDYDVDGGVVHEICVCGQQKVTHNLPFTALALGNINITVRAESMENALVCGNVIMSSQIGVRDTVIRELLIEAEGKEEELAFSSFMCLSEDETSKEHYLWTVPDDIVADSLRISVTAMGDVMGPALSGLDSLLRLPTGCGEQNMLKFAPNIYILQYLTNAHELNEEIEKKALDYMRTGYQRELTYRHKTAPNIGAYSAFGESDDSGSTWLTAFVLKSFSQAQQFIDIDDADLRVTRQWFERNQLENGCFKNVGRILHKSMKGGLASDQDSLAPLTAYSLVALLEAGYHPESDFIRNAVGCLSRQEYATDLYSVALASYALSLLGRDSTLAQSALHNLDQFKTVQDGMTFWSVPSADIEQTDSHRRIKPADVEITAYALMTHLNMAADPISDLQTTLPIVRWLTAQRNPNGGFLSTQDTVVALQALAKFANIIKSESGNVDVSVMVDDETHDFMVTGDNHLLLQKKQLTTLPDAGHMTDIRFSANGSGCALVQAGIKYNVLNVTRGSTHSINLDVSSSRTEDNTCYQRILNICVRYEGPDDATNMALLNVKMVTGWSPITSTVEKLKQDVTLHLSRFEVDKKNVNLYFTELLRGEDVCLQFTINQDIEVRNSKPATVTIYDYYDQQDVFRQMEYRLRSICGTKEELPFGVDPSVEGDISQVRLRDPVFPGQPRPTENVEAQCPVCHTELPDTEQLKAIFCIASRVYRGMVKKPGVLKVHKDLVAKTKVNKLVSVTQAEHCTCPPLDTKKQWVWIITQGTEVMTVSRKQGTMELTGADQVIPISKRSKTLDRLLKKIKRSKRCRETGTP